ncbi:MAG: hypothetical protein LBM08_05020, partial [Dysgonamonadaceae bacterium]|nr:hypothetical protein [Dysgonamonadaceae bacterium]
MASIIEELMKSMGDGDYTPVSNESENPNENKDASIVERKGKPAGWTDDQYDKVLEYYAPEAISKYFGGDYQYNPNEGPFLQSFIDSTKKPEPVDEKQARRARLAAGIGDSLGMIVQMIAASRGAHIQERDASKSALAGVNAEEEKLRNLYMQQDNDYQQGLYGARAKDLMKGLEDHKYNRQNIYNILASKEKMDTDERQLAERNAQWEKDFELRVKDFELRVKNFEATEKERDDTRKDRKAALAASRGNAGGDGQKLDYNKIAAMAYSDPNFMKLFP